MAESVSLEAKPREGRGSHKADRLRKQGLVPGVVYGHKEATVSIAVSGEELEKAVRHGVRVIDLKLSSGVQKALIRDIQWDFLGKDLLHVDFARVSADERIHVTIPVELKGIAPGVTAGGVLDQPMHALHVECPAINVPDSVRVNINELQLGGMIHVRELTVPPDVKLLDDPEAVVVHVKQAGAEPEPTEATGAAEPEVIGRQKAAEESED